MSGPLSKQIGLIKLAKAGDKDAVRVLIEQNLGLIIDATRKAAPGVDYREYLGEATFAFVHALMRFDRRCGSESTYIYRVIKNWLICVRLRENRHPAEELVGDESRRQDEQQDFDEPPASQVLGGLLDVLSDIERRVVLARAAGMTYTSISSAVGTNVSPERIRQILSAAIKKIRDSLGDYEPKK